MSRLKQYMPAPDFGVIVNHDNASNSDVQSQLEKAVPKAVDQTKKIAKHFKGHTIEKTCSNIHKFLREEITYQADGESFQDIRLPSRFLASGVGDCKSYTLFSVGVLANLGIPCSIRYTSYDTTAIPSHVYVAIPSNPEIVLDGTIPQFNKESKPTYRWDKQVRMQVRTLTGHNQQGVEGVVSWVKDKAKEVWQKTKTVGLSPARASFLLLVGYNFRGWASGLNNNTGSRRDAMFSLWKKIGGDRTKLANAIAKGAKRKRIAGTDQEGLTILRANSQSIGVEPTVLAAALAAASSIAVAFGEFIKAKATSTENADDLGFDPDDFDVNQLPDGDSYGGGGDDQYGGGASSGGGGAQSGGGGYPPQRSTGFQLNPMLLLGGLGLLLVLKK